MKIYVASSWRNMDQPWVVAQLRGRGYEVYDFKNPTDGDQGFHWKEVGLAQHERPCSIARLKEALAHPRAVEGFAHDSGAMKWADACVLVLPAGRSAHLEAGWMAGAGKKVLVYASVRELIEPELMYGLCGDALCPSFEDVLRRLGGAQ